MVTCWEKKIAIDWLLMLIKIMAANLFGQGPRKTEREREGGREKERAQIR